MLARGKDSASARDEVEFLRLTWSGIVQTNNSRVT
jgi:hypothetical protein